MRLEKKCHSYADIMVLRWAKLIRFRPNLGGRLTMDLKNFLTKISFFGLALFVFTFVGAERKDLHAQNKGELSDKTVNYLTRFALSAMPKSVTDAEGKKIEFTVEDLKKAAVPKDSLREIIKVGYRSAQAQNCGLATEYQVANYQMLVRLVKRKTDWTPVQRVFVSRLHWATVSFMTGSIEVIDPTESAKGKDKIESRLEANKKINKQAKKNYAKCTDEKKAKIQQAIEKYVKTAQAKLK